ncbi:hypothetical protein KR009_004292 [Drosophila setifemur]|nr:hypothetical protein KR009_004292 [Drosophila setifemur]
MSKYQKLDGARPPTALEDDCDEGYALYFDDNQTDPALEPANEALRMPNGNRRYFRNNSNGHNINNNSIDSAITIAPKAGRHSEDQTWEVLLGDDNQVSREGAGTGEGSNACHSLQAGFAVNLKSKSSQEAKFKILLAISLCCIFMIIEFLGGYAAGSLAIMTDAAHLASDCISFVIGLVAIWVGDRPPDKRMSFGYKRFEVVGALTSILGIWLLTTLLVVVAIQRIYSQDFHIDVDVMMAISGIGIAINIVMMFVLHGSWFGGEHGHSHNHGHGHSHGHSHGSGHSYSPMVTGSESSLTAETLVKLPNGHNSAKDPQLMHVDGYVRRSHAPHVHEEKNLNLRAAMIHVIGDLVQSIGVFLAAVLIKFCPSAKYADPVCTLLFSVIVIITTVQLFRESMGILLDAVPSSICLRSLERDLTNLNGVRSVHHLNVWQHTSDHKICMAHLVTDQQSDGDAVMLAATKLVYGSPYNVKHATIQIERATS